MERTLHINRIAMALRRNSAHTWIDGAGVHVLAVMLIAPLKPGPLHTPNVTGF